MTQNDPDLTARDLRARDIRATNVVSGAQHIINHYYASGGQAQDKAQLQTQITSYLRWLAERCGRIELRGIERAGGAPVVLLDLDTAYVPLEATLIVGADESGLRSMVGKVLRRLKGQTEPDGAGLGPRSETFEVGLNKVTELSQRLVITGGPGCGKTTVLLHIAWALAASLLNQADPAAQTHLGLSGELPLPILVPLASFARHRRNLRADAPAEDRTLGKFISSYLIGKDSGIALPTDFFSRLLQSGQHVMLLLDGLDEVANEDERALVREAVDSLVAGKDMLHTIVTCRTIAYKSAGTALGANFKEIAVKPLDFDEHVKPMIERAYQCIFPNDAGQRQDRSGDLLRGIQALEADRQGRLGDAASQLVDSPLMVRLLLIVHYNERRLPDERAKLFEKAVNALIQVDYGREEEVRQALAAGWETRRDMAQHLAFHLHQQGRDQGREIDEAALKHLLKAEEDYKPYLTDFLAQTRNRGGLLEEREGAYRFIHLAFQEFLTARYLREVTGGGGLTAILDFLDDDKLADPWWREPVLLLAGYLASNAAKNAREFLRKLALAGGTPDAQLAAAELAGMAALEWKESGDALRSEIASRIVALYADITLMSTAQPSLRARAGRMLGKLGDPRNEVLHVDDLHVCAVPPGQFYMGSPADDKTAYDDEQPAEPNMRLDYGYFIGQHPITQAQFGEFVAAEGYKDKRWWTTALADGVWSGGRVTRRVWFYEDDKNKKLYFREEPADAPRSFGEPFDLPNHPVVGISWYEAIAFCDWLTARWQTAGILTAAQQVRLPNEPEWEKAARCGDYVPVRPRPIVAAQLPHTQWAATDFAKANHSACVYPFSGASVPSKHNIDDTHLNATSPAGCFPNGASAYGCHDLSGNVWEWTRSAWGPRILKDGQFDATLQFNYAYQPSDGREQPLLGKDMTRVVRGGSWNNNLRSARCAYRDRLNPDNSFSYNGFRIVVSPFFFPL